MKFEHFENVKNVCGKRRNFQNLMVAKGLMSSLSILQIRREFRKLKFGKEIRKLIIEILKGLTIEGNKIKTEKKCAKTILWIKLRK